MSVIIGSDVSFAYLLITPPTSITRRVVTT